MPEKTRDMVESKEAHKEIATARNMPDAANAGQSLMGYAAVNGMGDQDEIARLAYRYFQEREEQGREGSADDDWFRAESEVVRKRNALNA